MRKQNAAALIVALFIMATVAIIATAISYTTHLNIRRTESTINYQKLYAASDLVLLWCKKTVSQPSIKNQNFPIVFPSYTEGFLSIQGQLGDETGKFNLNNLKFANLENANDPYIMGFSRLLNVTEKRLSNTVCIDIARALASFLQSQNRLSLRDKSELLLIPNFPRSVYQKLAPYITALPAPTRINLNTASMQVLLTLSPELSQEQALRIIHHRHALGGFKSQMMFFSDRTIQALNLPMLSSFDTRSQYVSCQAKLNIDHQKLQSIELMRIF